jgi:hypothetical protein
MSRRKDIDLKLLVVGLLLPNLSSGVAMAAVYSETPNSPLERTFNITGKEAGPYNIKVTVNSPLQKIIEANNKTPLPPDSKPKDPTDTFGTLFPNLFGDESHHHGPDGTDKPFVTLGQPGDGGSMKKGGGGPLFPNLMGDESHHHGPNGSDQPFVTLMESPPDPLGFIELTLGNPYLQSLPPRLADDNYVCYNYAWEQLTGMPTDRMLNADDVKRLLRNYNHNVYKPGSQLPDTFPPGTVLFFNGHVGIVGKDGKTVFNYTAESKENGLPPKLHITPSASDVWNTTNPDNKQSKPSDFNQPGQGFLDNFIPASGETPAIGRKPGNQPYVRSPAESYTPPGR